MNLLWNNVVLRILFWVIAVGASVFLITEAGASTGAFAGILEKVGPPNYAGPNDSERDKKLKSFHIRSKFVLYQSNTVHRTGELVDWYQLRTDSSPSLGGWLTSPEVFERALPHFAGHYMYVYEDKHFDLSPTPTFTFGLLREADLDKGELKIDVAQTSLRFHYSENPILRVTAKVDGKTQYKVEPWKDLPRENVEKMLGRWVQVHPPREQLIWVESEESQWDADRLPTRATNATRGGPNSLTHMTGKNVGEKPLKRYVGWFEVGESGLHEIRGAGSSGDCVLLLNGVRVIDTLATQDYGWGFQPYLQQRTRVWLEKGWHRFEFYHDKRRHTLTWNGPGVTFENPHHDIGPIYHLADESGDAQVRFWITGKATSLGRPLIEQDGSTPKRTGEHKVIIDK